MRTLDQARDLTLVTMNCFDNSHDHRGHGPYRVTAQGRRARSSSKSHYDELLHTHRVRLAPERANAHRQRLEDVKEELAEWCARVAHEERMLRIQEQLSQGAPWEDAGPAPRWRDYRQATTRGGEAFLIGTVGARAPRN